MAAHHAARRHGGVALVNTVCPECGEEFELSKPDGEDGMAPWFLDVYHDHKGDKAKWVGVVYQHAKGQRYPPELKPIVEERKVQKARVRAEKKAHTPDVVRCPLHPKDKYPEGCPR